MRLKLKLAVVAISFLPTISPLAKSVTNNLNKTHPTKQEKLWQSIKIHPKVNTYLSGNIPYFPDKKWQFLNHQIQQFFTKYFDNRDAKSFKGKMQLTTRQIYQDDNYLSIAIDMEINDFTPRYFTDYYTLDLKNHKVMTLSSYLKSKNIKFNKIKSKLVAFLSPCMDEGSNKKSHNELCDDATLGYLVSNKEDTIAGLEFPADKGFFIPAKGKIGIAYNSAKFTSSFVYDEKTKIIKMGEN